MMKQTSKRALSWVLTILMALSCLTVVPMAVSAETAPVVDGVKDDIYTDAKKTVISTAFAGAQQGAIENTTNGTITMWYAWDDAYNYVYVEISEPGYTYTTQNTDVFYYINNADEPVQSFIHLQEGGGYLQYKFADASFTSEGSNMALAAYDSDIDTTTGQTRKYEFSFARKEGAEGFRVSPVICGNSQYCISYGSYYNTLGGKIVKYADETTWAQTVVGETVAPPTEDETIDGVKDDRYSDAKKMTVTRAYAGGEQAETENTSGISIDLWYAWDDDYNYVYAEFKDPNGAGEQDAVYGLDYLYFTNNTNELVQSWIWGQTGGGYMEHKNVSDALGGQGPSMISKFVKGDGVRQYEIRFARDAAADGFRIGATAMTAADFIVASDAFNSTKGATAVKYEDESTWVQNFAPTSGDEGGEGEGDGNDTPTAPTPAPDGIDAIKDDRYDEEKMTIISKAYGGSGASNIVNRHHIYTKMYYAWDDTNNYVYVEIHDPFMTQGLDVLYYVTNTNTGSGNMFIAPGGGYIQFNTADGKMSASADADGRTIKYASWVGEGVRQYEFVLPKTEGAIGLQLSPVAYREDGKFTVSYATNYYLIPAKNILFENQAGHWTDVSQVDADVMTDPTKIEEVETALAKLPADASTLTWDDKGLYDEVAAVMAGVPDSWQVFIDADLYSRYTAAKARMLVLEAEVRAAEIKGAEDLIAALPETVTLDNLDDVEAAKAAVDALGQLSSSVNADLLAKLNAHVSYLQALQAPVKIDGKKDAFYDTDMPWPISAGFMTNTQSDIYETDPLTVGNIYTAADDNFAYIYIEVIDGNGIVDYPADQDWATGDIWNADAITLYLDMDPTVAATGTPYQDVAYATDNVFYFTMLADGRIPEKGATVGKTDFLHDAASFVSFRTENTYGFEMKVPRVEGEESFRMNPVISDPGYVENEEGVLEWDFDTSRAIALGPEWSYNYVNYGEKFYSDYAVFYTYAEVVEMIEELPAVEDLVDDSYDKKLERARKGLDLLNEDALAFVSQELIDKLEALEAKREQIIIVEFTYGDLNDDGEENAVDALMILQIAVDKLEATENQEKAADVSGDGKIDATDALYVLQKAVNKISEYPAEKK